jgi:hypothetical protein
MPHAKSARKPNANGRRRAVRELWSRVRDRLQLIALTVTTMPAVTGCIAVPIVCRAVTARGMSWAGHQEFYSADEVKFSRRALNIASQSNLLQNN